ncbi:MAG: Gfo/Idh/MocA family oxidoreductase [bacterium]|nr:Gfo/Idh/MocA family oxidoreductase [bacterium]
MNEIGFGIIGCGMGAVFHLAGIEKAPDAKLIAVADTIPEKAEQFATKYNVPLWYDDYHKLLTRPDIDVVSICTPSGLHSEIAVSAAKSGKHILCEKPMDITLPAIDRMINAAEQANVKLGIVLQWRTYETFQKVRQAVHNGELGKMVLGDVYLKYYRSQEYYNSAPWRGTWALDGGGALMNQGIHGIDILQWIMGDIDTVYAKADHLVRHIEVEDTAVAIVSFKTGAFGTIIGTTSTYPAQIPQLALHGALGTIIIEEHCIKRWVVQGENGNPNEITQTSQDMRIGGIADPSAIATLGHERIIQNMLDAIRYNKPLYCSGVEGRKSVEIILATYQSAKTGKEVKLPL